jgi:hypothetical protein
MYRQNLEIVANILVAITNIMQEFSRIMPALGMIALA